MIKRYFVKEHPDSKKYKNVPYITKKQFQKENEDYTLIGKTILKKYDSDNQNKDVEVLCYEKENYLIKEKVFGFRKGYILIEDSKECVELKRRIPFLLILLLLCLLLFLIFHFISNDNPTTPNNTKVNEPIIEKPLPPVEDIKEPIEDKPIQNKEQYKITYHLNGGILENENPSVYTLGDKKNLSNPTKIGYIFEGWFDNEQLKGYSITSTSVLKGNKDLYAKWSSISYIIKYHSYDKVKEEKYNYDQEYKLLKNPFEKEGHTFIGWSMVEEGEILYQDEAIIKNITTKNNEVINLYANWKINEYNIAFKDYDDSIISTSNLEYGTSIDYPKNLQRAGYIFNGWDNDSKIVKEDLVINAKYKIETYRIDYELNDGLLDNPIKFYNVESNDFNLSSPNKKGYTFTGWSNAELITPIIELSIPKGSTGDKSYTANWEANEYKVTLNPNGGNVEKDICLVKYDSNYNCLTNPTKYGYDFDGWFDDEDKITNESILKKDYDHELSAKWNLVDYNIDYDLVGGKLDNPIHSYNVESESIIINYPVKDGYIFTGWTINDNPELIKDLIIEKGTTGNLLLKANYVPISYSIVYNANGGTGEIQETTATYDQKITLADNSFEYIGKRFIGWSLSKDADIIYKNQDSIINLTNRNNEKIVLYAKWETIYYNVVYYDWNNEILKEEKIASQTESKPPENPLREGYTFVSWDNNDFTISKDSEYHPIYEKNKYNIQYDLNMDNADDIHSVEYDIESNEIILPTPKREGYTFLGWKDMETIKVYDTITIPKGSTGNKLYRAEWKANHYTVTFNPNGGEMINTIIRVTYNSLYGILPTTSRTGYTFEGWYFENDLVTEDTILKRNYNHELTAKWRAIDYSINYSLNGGTANDLITKYNIESNTFTLPEPTRNGYTFLGWTGSNGATPNKYITISKGSTGDKSYTANWQVNNYSISYDLAGGTANNLKTQYNLETETFTLEKPIKEGYDFLGWTGSNGSTPQTSVTIYKGTSGNKSYTANWRKYNARDYGGIYMVSTRNNVTWAYTLDGFYKVGDTNVHSGNWLVTVSDYCVNITGTKYPDLPFTYQFYIYKANSTSELLATGNASVLGNYQNNAKATICW